MSMRVSLVGKGAICHEENGLDQLKRELKGLRKQVFSKKEKMEYLIGFSPGSTGI